MRRSVASRERGSCGMRAAVFAMALLILAVGFCLFDGDEHDAFGEHASLDLCLGLITISLPAALVAPLPLAGLTTAYRPTVVPTFLPHVPAPPPKRLF